MRLLDDPTKTVGEIFNVGASDEITVNQLAQQVIERSGSRSTIVYIPYSEAYAPGFEDMRRRVPDTNKIHRVTGWEPEFGLDQILDDVIRYESDELSMRRLCCVSAPWARVTAIRNGERLSPLADGNPSGKRREPLSKG